MNPMLDIDYDSFYRKRGIPHYSVDVLWRDDFYGRSPLLTIVCPLPHLPERREWDEIKMTLEKHANCALTVTYDAKGHYIPVDSQRVFDEYLRLWNWQAYPGPLYVEKHDASSAKDTSEDAEEPGSKAPDFSGETKMPQLLIAEWRCHLPYLPERREWGVIKTILEERLSTKITATYIDKEGDEIPVDSQCEFDEYLRFKAKYLREDQHTLMIRKCDAYSAKDTPEDAEEAGSKARASLGNTATKVPQLEITIAFVPSVPFGFRRSMSQQSQQPPGGKSPEANVGRCDAPGKKGTRTGQMSSNDYEKEVSIRGNLPPIPDYFSAHLALCPLPRLPEGREWAEIKKTMEEVLNSTIMVTHLDEECSITVDSQREFEEYLRLNALQFPRNRQPLIIEQRYVPSTDVYAQEDVEEPWSKVSPIAPTESESCVRESGQGMPRSQQLGGRSVQANGCGDAAPKWFIDYMEAMKKEIVDEVSERVTKCVTETLSKRQRRERRCDSDTSHLSKSEVESLVRHAAERRLEQADNCMSGVGTAAPRNDGSRRRHRHADKQARASPVDSKRTVFISSTELRKLRHTNPQAHNDKSVDYCLFSSDSDDRDLCWLSQSEDDVDRPAPAASIPRKVNQDIVNDDDDDDDDDARDSSSFEMLLDEPRPSPLPPGGFYPDTDDDDDNNDCDNGADGEEMIVLEKRTGGAYSFVGETLPAPMRESVILVGGSAEPPPSTDRGTSAAAPRASDAAEEVNDDTSTASASREPSTRSFRSRADAKRRDVAADCRGREEDARAATRAATATATASASSSSTTAGTHVFVDHNASKGLGDTRQSSPRKKRQRPTTERKKRSDDSGAAGSGRSERPTGRRDSRESSGSNGRNADARHDREDRRHADWYAARNTEMMNDLVFNVVDPMHILPPTLVTGAVNVAASAYVTARRVYDKILTTRRQADRTQSRFGRR